MLYRYYSVHAKEATKVWHKTMCLCELKCGYYLNYQIYKGKEGDNQESGLAYRVVVDLMRVYLNWNHCLFVGNYYTSPKLFLDLEKQNTFTCDTIRSNCGQFPD